MQRLPAIAADDRADPTAWFLHAHLHRLVPRAKVILHTHMPYATALACLDGFELQMLDQSSCRFFGRVAYDRKFGGMFLDDSEGPRLAALLADGVSTVFLGNHGVMVVGASVAEAFDDLYYLERVCELHVLAMSTGRPLALIPDDIAALGLDLRLGVRATRLRSDDHVVELGEHGEIAYDGLVIATGASPRRLPAQEPLDGLVELRTIADSLALRDRIADGTARVVVIGAGFIGLETAENLAHKGIPTTVIEAAPQVLTPLDSELAIRVEGELASFDHMRSHVAPQSVEQTNRHGQQQAHDNKVPGRDPREAHDHFPQAKRARTVRRSFRRAHRPEFNSPC